MFWSGIAAGTVDQDGLSVEHISLLVTAPPAARSSILRSTRLSTLHLGVRPLMGAVATELGLSARQFGNYLPMKIQKKLIDVDEAIKQLAIERRTIGRARPTWDSAR